MEQSFGWFEMAVFGTFALGFGLWQLVSINKEIARDKAAKDAAAKDKTRD